MSRFPSSPSRSNDDRLNPFCRDWDNRVHGFCNCLISQLMCIVACHRISILALTIPSDQAHPEWFGDAARGKRITKQMAYEYLHRRQLLAPVIDTPKTFLRALDSARKHA